MLGLGGILDMYNNYGCSIDAHCRPIMDHEFFTPTRGNTEVGEEASEFMQGREQLPTEAVPTSVTVPQSTPNPFTSTAQIHFGLPTNGAVTVDIFDVTGRHVVSLLNDERPAGYHEVIWDGRNARGSQVPAGIYFYRVQVEDETLMKKMILMK